MSPQKSCLSLVSFPIILALAWSQSLSAQTTAVTWSGALDGSWNDLGNWNGALVPDHGIDVSFPSEIPSSGSVITLPANATANYLSFNGDYTLSGGSIALTDGTVEVQNTAVATLAVPLLGSAKLQKFGTGQLKLSASTSSYTGPTYIFEGEVSLAVAAKVTSTSDLWVQNIGSKLTIAEGSTFNTVSGSIGLSGDSSSNKVEVSGAGSVLTATGTLNVGYDGQSNRLQISSGGKTNGGSVWVGGLSTASNNSVTLDGTGTTFGVSAGGSLIVGYLGSGNSMNITGGATATSTTAYLGFDAVSATNSVLISGTGSKWTNAGTLFVGSSGSSSQINIEAGGNLALTGAGRDVELGSATLSSNNAIAVSGTGSKFNHLGVLYVGKVGSNNLVTSSSGGSIVSGGIRLGSAATSTGNIARLDGANSTWTASSQVRLGDSGDSNQMVISGGGIATFAQDAYIGYASTAENNNLTISGAGSKLLLNGTGRSLVIGNSTGTGNKALIENGGELGVRSIQVGPYGTLQIGNSSASGIIPAASTITGNNSGGMLVFRHTDSSYTLATKLAGSLRVVHESAGITVLTNTNTNTGGLVLNAGTLNLGSSGAIGSSGTITFSGGTLQFSASNATDYSSRFNNSVNQSYRVDTNGRNVTLATALTSSGGSLTKSGGGTLTLSGNNTFTGATVVLGGELKVGGSLSSASSLTVASGGILSGIGSVGATVIQGGATVSPGNSTGKLTVNGSVTWSPGGNYNWQVTDTAGTAGVAWDYLAISGSLELSSLSEQTPFNINLWSLSSSNPDVEGNIGSFDITKDYLWTIATAAEGIRNFNANFFSIKTSTANGTGGFRNDLSGGQFKVEQSGNNLNLVYQTSIPEPSSAVHVIAAVLAGLFPRRRSAMAGRVSHACGL